jgi:hypothetical protein
MAFSPAECISASGELHPDFGSSTLWINTTRQTGNCKDTPITIVTTQYDNRCLAMSCSPSSDLGIFDNLSTREDFDWFGDRGAYCKATLPVDIPVLLTTLQ